MELFKRLRMAGLRGGEGATGVSTVGAEIGRHRGANGAMESNNHNIANYVVTKIAVEHNTFYGHCTNK